MFKENFNTKSENTENQEAPYNYYKILDVSASATINEIRSAFNRWAKKNHPDTTKDDAAEEQFKQRFEIMKAICEFLSDEDKRAAYDAKLHRQAKTTSLITELSAFDQEKIITQLVAAKKEAKSAIPPKPRNVVFNDSEKGKIINRAA